MIPHIPWYLALVVVAANLAVAVAIWRILAAGAVRAGLPHGQQRRFRIAAGLIIAGWLGAVILLAPSPASLARRDAFYLTPLIPFFNLAAVVLVLVALRAAPLFRRALKGASLPALHGVQVYRTVGVVFVILLAQGQLPAHFALPAGWGDIAIGLAAPFVALALARGVRGAVPLAVGWNALGLLDLVVAVGMGTGFLAPYLAPELGGRVPPAAAMGVLPMILVPAFAVPISVLLHLLSLGRIRRAVRAGGRLAASPAR